LTGRNDEPESQHDARWQSPTATGGWPPAEHGVGGGPSGPYPLDQQSAPEQAQGNPSVSGPNRIDPSAHGQPPGQGPGQHGQQPAQRPGYFESQGGQGGYQPPPMHDLSSAQLLRQNKRAPQSGWRKALFVASGRTVNVGESPLDVQRRELIGRINQPLHGCYKIAMLSLKGGVGKTTITTMLGSTFASLRGDRVIAVDANPDRGTLSQKIPLETTATVRHLLRDAQRIRRYSDIRSYTSQGPSRLEILASEQDPAVSEAFSEDDYRSTVNLLEHFYNILLTDCGTGLMHSAMKGVLDSAGSLVIVSSGSIDGARSASATLDWLDAHGYRELVSRSVAVINSVRPRSGKVDLDRVAMHFAARCRSVCRMPFDEHLEEGGEIDLDRLGQGARLAALELAATVADGFPNAVTRAQ
jgi:MinD-like ATPase involved in chromosome partitioning or flagellar assembly